MAERGPEKVRFALQPHILRVTIVFRLARMSALRPLVTFRALNKSERSPSSTAKRFLI